MSSASTVEEKVFEHSMESLISRSRELKNAIEQFVLKIEHEHASLTWPSVLDNFALLSSQMSSLFSLLHSEKIASLQDFTVIPLRLEQEEDQFMATITEGRLSSLNHANVPDYLRTKPAPEVEQTERQLTHEANAYNDASVKLLNKQCEKMLDKIKQGLASWKNEQQHLRTVPQTSNPADTIQLIAASTYGRDMAVRQTMSDQNQLPAGGGKMQGGATVKVQSHPYSRS